MALIDDPAAPDPDDRRPKTDRGRATRDKLLDAALIEFGERGYHEGSISAITQRAGVGLGTFYVHFKSKEAVFRDLLTHMGRTTRAFIAERVAAAPDRLAAERIGVQAYIELVRQNRYLYRIVMEAQFVAEDAYRDYYYSFAEAYRQNLDRAAGAGEIRAGSEVHAWALIGMSVFIGLRFGMWDDSRPAAEVAAEVHDLIAHGLLPGAGQGPAP